MTKRSSKTHVSCREKPIDVHLVRALRFFACSHYRRGTADTLTLDRAGFALLLNQGVLREVHGTNTWTVEHMSIQYYSVEPSVAVAGLQARR